MSIHKSSFQKLIPLVALHKATTRQTTYPNATVLIVILERRRARHADATLLLRILSHISSYA